jgi:hypothetical protein
MPSTCVGLARPADAATVTAIRIAAYERAPEFELLRPDLLAWDPADASRIVLAGWDAEGSLVATFQGIGAPDAAAAADILGVSVEMPAECFPSYVIGRAATAPGKARLGLNSVLRWHFLAATITAGYGSTMGLAYTAAPRINTMAAMGYRFVRPARVWDPEVRPLSPPILCYLPASGFGTARAVLATQAAEAIAAHPWVGPGLVLPRVGAP